MFIPLKLFTIRKLLNQERVYALMLAFILLLNAGAISAQKLPWMNESFLARRILGLHLVKQSEEEFKYAPLADEKILLTRLIEKKPELVLILNVVGILILLIFGLGIFLDIHILVNRAKGREIIPAQGRHLRTNWGLSDILKLVIIFIFLEYALHIIETNMFFAFLAKEKSIPLFIPLLNTGIMDVALFCFIIYFVKIKYRHSLEAIGLKIKNASKGMFLALLGYLAFIPPLTILLIALIFLAALFNYQPPPQTLFKLFLQEQRAWILVYSTLMVVLLGPIVEEVFFRGFAYNALKRKWGRNSAMVLTAVVFAGLHGNLVGFLPISALGFLLAYVYEKTGSLIASITVHMLHNSLMVSLLFLARLMIQFTQ